MLLTSRAALTKLPKVTSMPAARKLPDQSLLLQLLRYEPETGFLFWRERPAGMFATPRAAATWNFRYAHTQAFTAVTEKGYRHGRIFNKTYRAHRIIWKMETGLEPDQIDHEDHDRSNNRWLNLEDVSNSENHKNMRRRNDNRSGVAGIFWSIKDQRWIVRVSRKYVGAFIVFDAAVAARVRALAEYDYHPNHGKQS